MQVKIVKLLRVYNNQMRLLWWLSINRFLKQSSDYNYGIKCMIIRFFLNKILLKDGENNGIDYGKYNYPVNDS